MLQKKIVDEIKTQILCSINIFKKSDHLRDMWEDMVESEKPQMTIKCCEEECDLHGV
jgi:hypothetical protein